MGQSIPSCSSKDSLTPDTRFAILDCVYDFKERVFSDIVTTVGLFGLENIWCDKDCDDFTVFYDLVGILDDQTEYRAEFLKYLQLVMERKPTSYTEYRHCSKFIDFLKERYKNHEGSVYLKDIETLSQQKDLETLTKLNKSI